MDPFAIRRDLKYVVRDNLAHVIVQDPLVEAFHRIGLAEYQFLRCLQSAGTFAAAWEQYQQRTAADQPALTEAQAQAFCRWLVHAGLTEGSPSQIAKQNDEGMRWNPFFFRQSLLNPDRLLSRLRPLCRLYSWPCYLVLALFAAYAAASLWVRADEFLACFENILIADRVILAVGIWAFLKMLHELGHGLVCKKYGGRVPDAGLAFILFTPVAYIDVTASCRFAQRRQRIHVALAGVVTELLLATLAAFVWCYTDSALIQRCAADLIVMATVSSLVFNLNPLMRFDGYFVLADSLGIDNLYQLGRASTSRWLKRVLLGWKTTTATSIKQHRRKIHIYGAAATWWRIIVVTGLIVAAAAMFHGAGIVLAIVGVTMWFLMPAIRFCHQVVVAVRERQIRVTSLVMRLTAVSLVLVTATLMIPIELSRSAPGMVEYDPPVVVRAGVNGFVERIHVADGDPVKAGDPIVTMRNDDLQVELSSIATRLQLARQQVRSGHWHRDSSQIKLAQAEIDGLEKQRRELIRRLDQLVVRAPHGGRVVARRIHELARTYLSAGDQIASIGSEDKKRLRVSISQEDLQGDVTSGPVQVSLPHHAWRTRFTRIDPRATKKPPHQSMCSTGGGRLTLKRRDDGELELAFPRVTGFISLGKRMSASLYSGQRARVFFGPGSRTIGQWLLDWR